MLSVIIAEKPSVARNIADAVNSKNRRDGYFEGENYLITWAFGHLLELYDSKDYDEKMTSWRMDNYPFVPEKFMYKVKSESGNRDKVDEGAKKQLDIISSLINRNDVESVISATDYDREGQIIGDIILDYLKVEKPIKRLLLNEWTPDEVNGGLSKTIDNTAMSNLKDAGICRQFADWIIGINLTSVTTLKYQRGSGKPLNIGRVLLPTLKIVYDRDKEIEEFVPEEFHRLLVNFKTDKSEVLDSTYRIKNNEKFENKKILEEVLEKIKGHKARVSDKLVDTKKEYAPALFNLSNLQGYVTSKEKGWTSDKVLKVAQELYEKKLITYPRTSSIALDESLVEKTKKVLNVHKRNFKYEDEIKFTTSKRVFDNKKVESHSAIIPTYIVAKSLSKDEQAVYSAVRNRFLMQFMPIAEYEEAVVTIDFMNLKLEGSFVTKGRIQLVSGWKKIENIKSKDKVLPMLEIGQELENTKNKIETKGTKPPKKHNEKTLLKIMETCGKRIKQDKIKEKEVFSEEDSSEDMNEEHDDEMINAILSGFSIGTPATRAETIKKLKQVGYLDAKGKSLYVTDMGRRLVELYPIKELFDLEYTGRLEKTLSEIEKGNFTREKFLNIISEFTVKSVNLIKKDKYHVINELESTRNEGKEVLGKCPNCGSDVFEGEKGYGCSNWQSGCKFVIWKNDKFLISLRVKATKGTVRKLLAEKRVFSSSLVSKKGNKFSAYLSYEKNDDNDYFSWKLDFR